MSNYYEVLGIAYNATTEEIKKAYKIVALKTHPDKNSAPDAAEKFKLVVEAANTLKDSRKKAEYDAKNKHFFKPRTNTTDHGYKTPYTSNSQAADSATPSKSAQQKGTDYSSYANPFAAYTQRKQNAYRAQPHTSYPHTFTRLEEELENEFTRYSNIKNTGWPHNEPKTNPVNAAFSAYFSTNQAGSFKSSNTTYSTYTPNKQTGAYGYTNTDFTSYQQTGAQGSTPYSRHSNYMSTNPHGTASYTSYEPTANTSYERNTSKPSNDNHSQYDQTYESSGSSKFASKSKLPTGNKKKAADSAENRDTAQSSYYNYSTFENPDYVSHGSRGSEKVRDTHPNKSNSKASTNDRPSNGSSYNSSYIPVKPEPSSEVPMPEKPIDNATDIEGNEDSHNRARKLNNEAIGDGFGTREDPIVLDTSPSNNDEGIPQENQKTPRFEDVVKLFQNDPSFRKFQSPAERRNGRTRKKPVIEITQNKQSSQSARPARSNLERSSEFILVSDEEASLRRSQIPTSSTSEKNEDFGYSNRHENAQDQNHPRKKYKPVVLEELEEGESTTTHDKPPQDDRVNEKFNGAKKRKQTNFSFEFSATNGNIDMNDLTDSLNQNVAGNMVSHTQKRPKIDESRPFVFTSTSPSPNSPKDRSEILSTPVNNMLPKVHINQKPQPKVSSPAPPIIIDLTLKLAATLLKVEIPKPPKLLEALNSESWNRYISDFKIYKEKYLRYRIQLSSYFNDRSEIERTVDDFHKGASMTLTLTDIDLKLSKRQYEAMQMYKVSLDIFQQNCVWKNIIEKENT